MSSMTEAAAETGPIVLPADSHVHSQWSWDALAGSMEGTCQRAVEIGLPAVAFTEHADFTPWSLGPDLLELVPDDWATPGHRRRAHAAAARPGRLPRLPAPLP